MRRWFIFLMILSASFVFADVEVENSSVDTWYVYGEKLSGYVNLTIEDVSYAEEIGIDGGEDISMVEFLDENGAYYECSPEDCSFDYDYSNPRASATLSFSPGDDEDFIGFVLEGEDVVVSQVAFDISSDFDTSEEMPLSVEFFEDEVWDFSEFSDEYLDKDWGCFSYSDRESSSFLIDISPYCEFIELGQSDVFEAGVLLDGEDDVLVDMQISSEEGFALGSCEINFSAGEEFCNISSGMNGLFEAGSYFVCANSKEPTDYTIYIEDSDGESCGTSGNFADLNDSSRDYAIFARGVKYANASGIDIDFESMNLVDMANFIISSRYAGDCSEGCVLPLAVSGIPQNFMISNIDLRYNNGVNMRADEVYDIEVVPAEVNFNGILDLSFLNISVLEEGEYSARLDGEYLFEEDISIIPAPKIESVSPLNPAAAVPTFFRANIDFEENKSLIYEWDFGDNSTSTTNVSYVYHTYRDLDNYTLTLSVSAGGNSSSEKSFDINVISPENAVRSGLEARSEALKEVRADIDRLNPWYKNDLIKILEIDNFEAELKRLSGKFNNSVIDKEFRDIALELYALNVPTIVGANSFETPLLMTEPGDIDIGPVASMAGSVEEGNEDAYANAILTWQDENMDIMMRSKEVFASYWDGSKRDVLTSYEFDVTSKYDRESYFVINKPYGELYFDPSGSAARKVDSSSIIILDALGSESFNFYNKDNSRGRFFASPALTSLVIEADISDDCNYNFVCDKENGETPDNCRSDCKPIASAVIIFIIVLIVILVLYTFLQIWYKKHYEKYLFSDGAQLYNLLMYISNARARGLEDKKIARDLKEQGWSSERVDYAMMKSVGKTVGMIEIIPIEKIAAWNRNRKARALAKKIVRDAAKREEDAKKGGVVGGNPSGGQNQINRGFNNTSRFGNRPGGSQFGQGRFRRRP